MKQIVASTPVQRPTNASDHRSHPAMHEVHGYTHYEMPGSQPGIKQHHHHVYASRSGGSRGRGVVRRAHSHLCCESAVALRARLSSGRGAPPRSIQTRVDVAGDTGWVWAGATPMSRLHLLDGHGIHADMDIKLMKP